MYNCFLQYVIRILSFTGMFQRGLSSVLLALIFIFSCVYQGNGQAVSEQKLKAYNNYIEFVNESTHGLLIAHRLLELYNQEINKYVDLEGYQLNNYSNDDLPQNIFEDPDQWFYDTSPLAWREISKTEGGILGPAISKKLNNQTDQLKQILDEVNDLRLSIPVYIQNNDLTDTTLLRGVYDRLERCVDLYDRFFELQMAFEKDIQNTFSNAYRSNSKLYTQLSDTHSSAKKILRALRSKDDKLFGEILNAHGKNYSRLKLNSWEETNDSRYRSPEFKRRKKNILDKLSQFNRQANYYNDFAEVPQEYKLYGKFYYYHNSDIINKMNRYGFGYVFETNQLIKYLKLPELLLFEEPHYYRVIYPKKLAVEEDVIVSSDDEVEILPEKLKNRNVITSSRKIYVDSMKFQIELYDHMIQDGDIVSINFNGDWILEDLSLEAKPTNLKIRLNEEGKNYLLLHAENIGKRPPNTMAVSYFYKGEKQRIILKSDMNASEMIEIEYVANSDSN